MRTQKLFSDVLMSVSVLPFLTVLGFVLVNTGVTGDDAFGVIFAAAIGYGVAYLFALVCGLPGIFWSSEISKRTLANSRYSSTARLAVLLVIASPVVLLGGAFAAALLRKF